MMGSGEEEDDGGLTPTEDEDDVQRPSGPQESVSAHVTIEGIICCARF